MRQKGFMVGIELVRAMNKKVLCPGDKIGQKVIWEGKKKCHYPTLGDVCTDATINIDRPTLEELVDVACKGIKAVTGSG